MVVDECHSIQESQNKAEEPFVLGKDFEIISVEMYEVIDALSNKKLEEATSFVYRNEYNEQIWNITLKRMVNAKEVKANVVINYGVDFAEQYIFDSPIKIEEYNGFLKHLGNQAIMNVGVNSSELESS